MHGIAENEVTGGCYCGALRFRANLDGRVAGQCHCRACQHIAGGGPQYFHLVRAECFEWIQGEPKTYQHPGLDAPVMRFFCDICGTHIVTQRPDQAALVLKIGTLDDPSVFVPQVAICVDEAQDFHTIAKGIAKYEGIPHIKNR